MKNKYIIPLLSLFFILIIILYILDLYRYAVDYDGWIIGDWLLNFKAGFIRRGLSGCLILGLSDLINLEPNIAVALIQLICFLTYMVILFSLIRRKKINAWFLLMLLSPAALLFPVMDDYVVGRKELILFFLFAVYVLCLEKKVLRTNLVILLFSLALMVATLFHELIFFYIPYFVIAAYLKSKIDDKPFYFSKIVFIILGPLIAMAALLLYGKEINSQIICAGFAERGFPDAICGGILKYPVKYEIVYGAEEGNYILNYVFALLLGLIPYVFFIRELKHPIVTLRKFFFGFLFLLVFSLPLFVYAVDWGRWINIHFILLLFTSLFLLKDKVKNIQDEGADNYLVIPRLWKPETIMLKLSGNVIFLILSLSYITLWSMRHFADFSLFNFNFYIKVDYVIHQLINYI
jgi:hypothetical protein